MIFFPKHAKTKTDRIQHLVLVIGVGGLLLFMHLSAFGVFNNLYADACKGEGLWKLVGLALSGFSLFQFWHLSQTSSPSTGRIVAAGLTMVLALNAYAGFTYPY
jgi:hypothetical protein